MSVAPPPGANLLGRPRVPTAALAVSFAMLVGGALIFASGANPLEAYGQILIGALGWTNLPDTLNWATPLVGMTLAAAIPLRGGMINLGGDGQLAIGGLVGANDLWIKPSTAALLDDLNCGGGSEFGGEDFHGLADVDNAR